MRASLNLYRYQQESEQLRKNNDIIRKQLEYYRPEESAPDDLNWALIDLLDLQRKRIECLETGIFIVTP